MSQTKPTNSTVSSSAERFRQASSFSANFVLDRTICTVADWSHLVLDDGTGSIVYKTGGDPTLDQHNSTLCSGIKQVTTDNVGFMWILPVDIDARQAIDFRVVYTCNETSGSVTFTGLYKAVDSSDGSTTLAVGTVAFDTVWTGQTVGATAYIPQFSSWGGIDAAKTGVKTLVGGEDIIVGKVTNAITTATTLYIHGIQARYYKMYQR